MKPIIVGTDFSQCSYLALELAVDVANKLHTDIRLIWVRKEKLLVSNEHMELASTLAAEKMQQLCEQYRSKMQYGDITWPIKNGRVAATMSSVAEELGASMIVVGSNGASGYERHFIGSTAARIIQDAPCPVLIIREGFNFHKDLERIVVPIRINTYSRQKAGPASAMARLFGSTVHILGLLDLDDDISTLKGYLHQVESKMDNYQVPHVTEIRKYDNYCDTVLNYADEVKADLLVINTEQDRIISHIFLGTNAQQIVHASQIPVLCIHPDDIANFAK